MNSNQNFVVTHRPKIILFSEVSPLAITLTEQLLANYCYIKIVCAETSLWKEGLRHLKENKFLEVHKAQEISQEEPFDYMLSLTLSYDGKKSERLLIEKAKVFSTNVKALFILPFSLELEEEREIVLEIKRFQKQNGDIGIIYVGDLVGSRLIQKKTNNLYLLMNSILEGKTPKIPSRQNYFYLTSVYDVAKKIARDLFSFGPYGEEWAIIGQKVSLPEFIKYCQNYFPDLTCKIDNEEDARVNVPVKKVISLPTNVEVLLRDSFSWLRVNKQETKSLENKQREFVKTRKDNVRDYLNLRFVLISISVLFILLLVPFFTMALSFGGLTYAKNLTLSGNTEMAKKIVSFSVGTATFSKGYLNTSVKIPLFDKFLKESLAVSSILLQFSQSAERFLQVIELSRDLSVKVFSDEVYNPELYTRQISLNLDVLYNDLGFLQGELEGRNGILVSYLKNRAELEKLSFFRQRIYYAKKLSDNLATSLGKGGKKSYLILFQNNMELRPTGGFIGSFALVTFEDGRLVETAVSDVYSADGQLKGHVEPPTPIKDHLGEANWYLRDSNWDPDFVISSERAEWFLDKEVDKRVDGVVGIDLEVAKGILEVIGPIRLEEYSLEITKDNLYEKTQYEVESDFFPGSRKKSDFLTSLSKKILFEVTNTSASEYMLISKSFLALLEERHIQIFLHDKKLQDSISELGFDGAITQPVCSGNCFADWIGLVEANLGVNKTNYFIRRNIELDLEIDQEYIKRRVKVAYKNEANPALGPSGRYKTYTRLLVSPEVEVISVEELENNESKVVEHDEYYVKGRKEIGVLLELSATEAKKLVFSLQEKSNLSLDMKGEYRLYVRKQAGTQSDPIAISVNLPPNLKYSFEPEPFLTQGGVYRYNTEVSRDIFSRIYFE